MQSTFSHNEHWLSSRKLSRQHHTNTYTKQLHLIFFFNGAMLKTMAQPHNWVTPVLLKDVKRHQHLAVGSADAPAESALFLALEAEAPATGRDPGSPCRPARTRYPPEVHIFFRSCGTLPPIHTPHPTHPDTFSMRKKFPQLQKMS